MIGKLVNQTQAGDNALLVKVKDQLRTIHPLMTISAWASNSQDDMLRKVNSAVSVWTTEKKQTQANEEIAQAMDLDVVGNNEAALDNLLDKKLDERFAKERKALRKKYLADLKKSQRSTGRNAGSKGDDDSSDDSTKSTKSTSKKNPKKSKKSTKKKRVRFEEDTEDKQTPGKGKGNKGRGKQRGRGQGKGNRGGSNKGGRGGSGRS